MEMMTLHELLNKLGFEKNLSESPYHKLLSEYEHRWQCPLRWAYSGRGRLNGPKHHRNKRQFQRLRQLRQYVCVNEIVRYLELHEVSGILPDNIRAYRDAKNIDVVCNVTPATLSPNKSVFDMICFLDDYMWFNNETRTIVIISTWAKYKNKIHEIEEFINRMMKNPTILYGKPILPGIEVMVVFITE